MFVIIVGGGKTGSHLAGDLLKEGHQVRVIEGREDVLERLRSELPAEIVVEGDGSSPSVLENADIARAQVLAAVTGEDEANLVITTLARFEFNVPRVIARVNNPKNAWLYTPEMGVDVALNQSDILAHLIAEEMSLGDMMTLLKLRKGEYSVVEEKNSPPFGSGQQALERAEDAGGMYHCRHHPQRQAGHSAWGYPAPGSRRGAGRGTLDPGQRTGQGPGVGSEFIR